MKTVIMARGKGTRISSVASDIPKPMIKIDGVPVLEREICCLREQGFTDLILTVSHMSEQIIGYFGDGSRLGVNIEYFVEEQPLGNAGALFKLRDKLTDDFLLLNADAVFDECYWLSGKELYVTPNGIRTVRGFCLDEGGISERRYYVEGDKSVFLISMKEDDRYYNRADCEAAIQETVDGIRRK